MNIIKRLIRIIFVLLFLILSSSLWLEKRDVYAKNMNYLDSYVKNTIIEYSDGIKLDNALPVDDEIGSLYSGYKFGIINNTSTESKIYLINNIEDNALPYYDIRYTVLKNGEVFIDCSTLSEDGLLFTDNSLDTDIYEVRLWISNDASFEILGTQFSGKVTLL